MCDRVGVGVIYGRCSALSRQGCQARLSEVNRVCVYVLYQHAWSFVGIHMLRGVRSPSGRNVQRFLEQRVSHWYRHVHDMRGMLITRLDLVI